MTDKNAGALCCHRHGYNCDQGRRCPERAGNVYPDLIEEEDDKPVLTFDQFASALSYGLAVGVAMGAAVLASLWLAGCLPNLPL